MSTEPEDFLGELRLGRQLSTVWQVAAGGLVVLLGLAFLIPGRGVGLIGSIAPIATLLSFLIILLTLLNILELLAGSSERGGTYTLIHETLGGLGGFLAGWATLAGFLALMVSFLRAATDYLGHILLISRYSSVILALGLLVGMGLIQFLRFIPRRNLLWPALFTILLVLGVFFIDFIGRTDLRMSRAVDAFASDNFMRTAAWLFTGYAAIEIIMASRRQIRDPKRHLLSGLLAALLLGGLLFELIEWITAALPAPLAEAAVRDLATVVSTSTILPTWLLFAATILGLILATNASLVACARQLNALSRQGALPGLLRWQRPPFRIQPLLFAVGILLAAPLVIWAPASWLMDTAAAFFLVSASVLNLAALISRRTEPDRRRTVTIPFYPLVPISALALCAGMWLALPGFGLLGCIVWLIFGLLIYALYGRTHMIEAQEGVLVFRREPVRPKEEGIFRILVPVSAGVERRLMLGIATALARQTGGEVLPLQVIPIADPLEITEGRRIARKRNTLFEWSTREAAKSDVPTYPITRLARSIPEGILDTADEEQCDLILLSWTVRGEQQGVRMGQVLDPVIRRASCDVAVIAVHPEHAASQHAEEEPGGAGAGRDEDDKRSGSLRIENILVPTAGGPHAPLATRLALLLAREFDATTRVVYVADPDASEEDLARGRSWIERTIKTMREQMADLPGVNGKGAKLWDMPLESRVVMAEGVVEGIAKAGSESDLVFIGASEESMIDQVLFGSIPERVARLCPTPVLMVKRFRGLQRFWLQRVWDMLFGAVPTLTRQEQMEVYRQVQQDARPDVDFFMMVGLSAIIATFGLLQGSTAVIIGAMLVAPLFTPILAFSLAVVQGDVRLLSVAFEAALKGIALAIGLAILLTTLSPLRTVTQEIASRTEPNLFDLAVALASGAAGAYALARKDVAAAMPGVAIAAALVPPLGVVGIALAMGDPAIAGGGALLFVTNLIAIMLAGSVTLLLLGFRPSERARREGRFRWGFTISIVLLIAISIPLATVFVRTVQESRIRQTIARTLEGQFQTSESNVLESFTFEQYADQISITVTMHAQDVFRVTFANEIHASLEQALGRPVSLELLSIPVESIEVSPP